MPLPDGKTDYNVGFKIADEERRFFFIDNFSLNHDNYTIIDVSTLSNDEVAAILRALDNDDIESDWTYEDIEFATNDEDASDLYYENEDSELAARQVQDAIDEVEGRMDTVEATQTALIGDQHSHSNQAELDNITDAGSGIIISSAERTKLSGIEDNAKDDQNASEVTYSNGTSGLTATDVQAALDEIDGNLDTHEANTTNPHNVVANQVNITDSGSLFTGTEVEAALQECLSTSTTTEQQMSGDLIQLIPSSSATLSTNYQMSFALTSDTNLKISVRGSDGTTRTVDLTLA